MENSGIAVSVIIPAYNEEKYLDRCLKTIVSQTLENIEIIIVNDGSTDNTYDICEQYRAEYPQKIVVIHKKNEGLGFARNTGIKVARGEYIGFVDADDWVDVTMYESMYKCAKKNNSEIVICDVRKIFEVEGREIVEVSLPKECDQIDIGQYIKDGLNPAYSWNKLYRHDIWEKYAFKKMVYEDLDIILTILSNCQIVSYIQKPFNTYFKRENSITTSYTNIRLMDIMQAYKDAAYNGNEKYKDETVFCVAKRILINMNTPGLNYYRADFIELIKELIPLFENNSFVLSNKDIKKIFKYKDQALIPKKLYCLGEKRMLPCLNSCVKHYNIIKHNEEENGIIIRNLICEISKNGGILIKLDPTFHIPIGGCRTKGFFVIYKEKKVLMIGAQEGNEFIKILASKYNIEKSLKQNVEIVLEKFGSIQSEKMEDYKMIGI